MENNYVHLHLHSCHSERDAFINVFDLAKRVKELKQEAFAITDHGVMHAIPDAFEAAKKQGIKAIAGCEVYETDKQGSKEEHFHMILLAKNKQGYHNLMTIVSDAFENGFYSRPRTDWEKLEQYKEGLILSSACLGARIPQMFLRGDDNKAYEYAKRYKEMFGEDFYLELQTNTTAEQKIINQKLIEISKVLGIEMIVTADVHYLLESDATHHVEMLCLSRKKTMLSDDVPSYPGGNDYYLMNGDEVYRSLKSQGIDEAIIRKAMDNTVDIARRINFELEKEETILPVISDDANKELRQLVQSNFLNRLRSTFKGNKEMANKYFERAKFELETIIQKGMADYFLIVADYIKFAKESGIMVAPGRGSSAGSLVAYILGITEVDPIKYGLFFERFIDLTRNKLADIDTDFEDVRRHEVVAYLQRKYGAERVAKIGTTGTMTARKAFRNALKVYDIPFKESTRITSLIPDEAGTTIADAYEESSELWRLRKSKIKRNDGQTISLEEVFKCAEAFEGKTDNHGTHAAGVLLTPEPVKSYFPTRGKVDELVTQYVMGDIEALGGVKFDILGLKTLTIIGYAVRSIERAEGRKIDVHKVMKEANEREVYELISKGDTHDLFQIASSGMQQLCKRLKPTEFKDVVAITALYRPSALASGDTWKYADIKNGLKPMKLTHPEEKHYLGDTYGLILYQEQVMQLVKHFADWDYTIGDKLRKMNTEQLEERRPEFIEDANKKGYTDAKQMDKIWTKIVNYMGYGFNKSHAVAYTMLTYMTAWLKVFYPTHWVAAQMSVNVGDHDKIADSFLDIRRNGFTVRPPDVNLSQHIFEVDGNDIVFPMSIIKGVGEAAINELIAKRPFTSLEDMMKKCNLRVVSKRAMKPLILAGAFDKLYPDKDRKEIFAMYLTLKGESAANRKAWEETKWDEAVQSQTEMELCGVYFKEHFLEKFKFKNFFTDFDSGKNAIAVGTFKRVKKIRDKNKNDMGFMTIETPHGQLEVVVFASTWAKTHHLFSSGKILIVEGRKDGDKLLANTIREADLNGTK